MESAQRELLQVIAQNTHMMTMALMDIAGVGKITNDGQGHLSLNFYTNEQREAAPPPRQRITPGEVSTRWESQGVAAAWVFTSPPPCKDVEIVCSPDNTADLGMRCYATQKLVGGERKSYSIVFMDIDQLAQYREYLERET